MIDVWTLLCYFGAFFCVIEYAFVLYLTQNVNMNAIKVSFIVFVPFVTLHRHPSISGIW